MTKKAYHVYVKKADDWTMKDEMSFDYAKLDGEQIFFISKDILDDCEEVQVMPASMVEWLVDCESELVAQAYAKKVKAAAKRLEKDFKKELDKALEEHQVNGELSESG